MRVSLAGPRRQGAEGVPMLDPAGAAVILGTTLDPLGLAVPIAPSASTMFGPRGACLGSPEGPLYVCDTGHHRLLVWRDRPVADHTPADFVLGQPGFEAEGRNARGDTTAFSMNVPTGVAAGGGSLAVADAWNHRVLLWHVAPTHAHQPPDVVLGQADFSGGLANRGASTASAETLNWPYGVMIHDGRFHVADTGNRRVLVWNRMPRRHGEPADLVLGQHAFDRRDENAGASANAVGMRWPHGLLVANGALLVADAGDNRIMVWLREPIENGMPCDFVLGQKDFRGVDHNQAAYYPNASALNMPYGLALQKGRVIVADTASSRLIGYAASALSMNADAQFLAGQSSFSDKGDNRWGVAGRDTVCWPYNVAASGAWLVVADAGNNRVLLWSAL